MITLNWRVWNEEIRNINNHINNNVFCGNVYSQLFWRYVMNYFDTTIDDAKKMIEDDLKQISTINGRIMTRDETLTALANIKIFAIGAKRFLDDVHQRMEALDEYFGKKKIS